MEGIFNQPDRELMTGGGSIGQRTRRPIESAAYKKAPLERMGFPKAGPSKPFQEQQYSYTQKVRVTFPKSGSRSRDSFVDHVKGLNRFHALERARRNWEGATIQAVGKGNKVMQKFRMGK